MKTLERLNNYLYDKRYKITIMDGSVDIVGYEEIIDFSISKISVKYENKIITVEGTNLTIMKMVESEVLITGIINLVRIN